jgi:1-deoxy-D-xylulose-5-phosphate reductoisomerase
MSVPDMRYCIQYGLCGGSRETAVIDELDLAKISKLTFFEPDTTTFPLLKCAIDCKRMGGAMPAVLNAANEVAVDAFLNGKIFFADISERVLETVDNLSAYANYKTLDEILEADAAAFEAKIEELGAEIKDAPKAE